MAELPEELLKVIRKRWAELQSKEKKQKQKGTIFTVDVKTARYKCCRHFWICADCGIKRDHFFKWLNQDKQEESKGGRRWPHIS